MEYMNKRGGRIVLTTIAAPEKQDFANAQEAMQAALDLERKVNQVSLLNDYMGPAKSLKQLARYPVYAFIFNSSY